MSIGCLIETRFYSILSLAFIATSFRVTEENLVFETVQSGPYTSFECFLTFIFYLTHIILASFLWDIGKQNSPRCDAAKRDVPSGAILFAILIFTEK